MAAVNFSNVDVALTYASPHSKNAWAYIQGGWRQVDPLTPDGVTNMFSLLNCAKANGRKVSGSYESTTNRINVLYMI